MIAKASGRPGHGRRRTRGDAKKQSGRRRAIHSVFARRCACSDGTRSDRRPRFPAAAFDNERPRPRRMPAPSRAARKKKGRLYDRRMLTKPADGQGVGKARKQEICRRRNLSPGRSAGPRSSKNGRHRRLISRARDLRPGLTIPKGRAAPPAGSKICIQGRFHGRKWPPEARSPLIFSVSGRFSYLWACQRSETVCTATV